MQTYIVLLRAVNVSGKNIIAMKDLKNLLDNANFKQVKTYIQSGNIILQSLLDKSKVHQSIYKIIQHHFNLSIDIFVLTINEFLDIINNNPFPYDLPHNKIYITLLSHQPEKEYINKLSQIDFGKEEYILENNILYSYTPDGMANARITNTFIENNLKVRATGRNRNTIVKLKDIALEFIND